MGAASDLTILSSAPLLNLDGEFDPLLNTSSLRFVCHRIEWLFGPRFLTEDLAYPG